HAQTNGEIELIHLVRIIFRPARCSAFENDDRERSARAEFLSHQQAGPSSADNHHVRARQRLHSMSSTGRILRPLACSRLTGLGRKAWPKCLSTSSRLLMRGPGKPMSCQPTMSTLPPWAGSQNIPSMVFARSSEKNAVFSSCLSF